MTENISDPDYERDTYGLLNERMFGHAVAEALLGVAYELRTANLLALDRTLMLMQQDDTLDEEGVDLATKASAQILERLGLPTEPAPKETTP